MGKETVNELAAKEQKLNALKIAYAKNTHDYNLQRIQNVDADMTDKRKEVESSMLEIVRLEKELYGEKACSGDSPSILLQRHEYPEQTHNLKR